MKKIQETLTQTVSKLSNHTLHTTASLMVSIGNSAVTLSAVPFWHAEPELPQSMHNEIEGIRVNMVSERHPTKRIDELGRIILPSGLRRYLSLKDNEELSISVEGEKIIMQRVIPKCIVCDSTDNIQQLNSRSFCGECHIIAIMQILSTTEQVKKCGNTCFSSKINQHEILNFPT